MTLKKSITNDAEGLALNEIFSARTFRAKKTFSVELVERVKIVINQT